MNLTTLLTPKNKNDLNKDLIIVILPGGVLKKETHCYQTWSLKLFKIFILAAQLIIVTFRSFNCLYVSQIDLFPLIFNLNASHS